MPARRPSFRPPVRFARGLAWSVGLVFCVASGLAGCGRTPREPELKPEPVLTQPEPAKPPPATSQTPPAEDSAGPPAPQAQACARRNGGGWREAA